MRIILFEVFLNVISRIPKKLAKKVLKSEVFVKRYGTFMSPDYHDKKQILVVIQTLKSWLTRVLPLMWPLVYRNTSIGSNNSASRYGGILRDQYEIWSQFHVAQNTILRLSLIEMPNSAHLVYRPMQSQWSIQTLQWSYKLDIHDKKPYEMLKNKNCVWKFLFMQ